MSREFFPQVFALPEGLAGVHSLILYTLDHLFMAPNKSEKNPKKTRHFICPLAM